MLLIGDSGGGKTGALASLANAGYQLRILDFDNGLDILQSYVKPECMKNVVYETLTNEMKTTPDGPTHSKVPSAFSKAMSLCNDWKTPSHELGPVSSWGEQDILVIDSLSFLSAAVFDYVLFVNGRSSDGGSSKGPRQQDYGAAMGRIEDFLGVLYSDSIKCNVIVIAHIAYLGGGEGELDMKGYPNTLGKRLPPKVAMYFNTVVRAKSVGTGLTNKRVICTVSEPMLDLKNTMPTQIPAELPLSDGLLKIFTAVRNRA